MAATRSAPGRVSILNTPDGGRVGFTFDPVAEPGLLGTVWKPRFTADPGVFEGLEVEDVALSQNEDGTFGLYLLGGFAYNPREYTLVTKDHCAIATTNSMSCAT